MCSSPSPTFELEMPRFHSGAAVDRAETTKLLLPPISDVVWQQLPDTFADTSYLKNFHNDTTIKITQTNHTPELHHRVDGET